MPELQQHRALVQTASSPDTAKASGQPELHDRQSAKSGLQGVEMLKWFAHARLLLNANVIAGLPGDMIVNAGCCATLSGLDLRACTSQALQQHAPA